MIPIRKVSLRYVVPRVDVFIFGLLFAAGATATDITVSGLFPNKALVQINNGKLQTLSVGQKTPEGIVLVAVDRDSATFDVDGRRLTLGLGLARMAARRKTTTWQLADAHGR